MNNLLPISDFIQHTKHLILCAFGNEGNLAIKNFFNLHDLILSLNSEHRQWIKKYSRDAMSEICWFNIFLQSR